MRLQIIFVCWVVLLGLGAQIGFSYTLPVTEGDVANANAEVGVAQGKLDAATSHMTMVVQGLRTAFEASSDYVNAKQALDDATTAQDSQHSKVLHDLYATPDYQAAVKAKTDARKAVEEARKSGGDVMSASTDALAAGQAVTQMETNALDADPEYKADHVVFTAALKAMQALERRFKSSMVADHDWQQAKADFDKASGNFTAALSKANAVGQAKLNQDNKAAADRARSR